ncbi:MAG: hypothetical protein OXS29_09925 [bacterium]|nr:hypothetical protein [bacterium]MDE0288734.1 hypothetical protein [bacterium]MDE0437255.1 hypothetical protein [bacterium]
MKRRTRNVIWTLAPLPIILTYFDAWGAFGEGIATALKAFLP